MRELQNSLHAPRAASPVTIVEVEAFALEDKGAHAVLRTVSESCTWTHEEELTRATEVALIALTGMLPGSAHLDTRI